MSCGFISSQFIYYIQSSEIQENIVDIYIFTPPECTYNFFGLPLTFPLTLILQCTSELQTSITFLFVNENIKRVHAFS